MSFKLKGAPYDKNDMNIGVYKQNLTDGSVGKSNHTGIIIQNGIDPLTEKAVIAHDIQMVIVGPEAPLVNGVHDFFLADNALKYIPVIGPKKDGALLEGSKDFSKEFMIKHGIPTAKYQSFTKESLQQGEMFLECQRISCHY